jgi:hypothetical protein
VFRHGGKFRRTDLNGGDLFLSIASDSETLFSLLPAGESYSQKTVDRLSVFIYR